MPSLLDAIEAKYGSEDRDLEAPIGIYVPRIGPRKSIPRLLVSSIRIQHKAEMDRDF
jgi:hypothetical protein